MRPRQPHFHHRRQRWLRTKAVTIAAGFRFDTGILLCADTQYTGGAKTEESKIFPIRHHAATVVLVLTGRQLFAKRAVEHITDAIQRIPEEQLTKSRMQDEIETALRQVFNNHVYIHPDWGKDNAPDFSFVIGLYSPIDGDFLLASDETLTAEVTDHVCLGTGQYLGDYLSKMYDGRGRPLRAVESLASYILRQVKSYDAECGGNSEFIVLWDDGDTSPVGKHSIDLHELYADKFQEATTQLFYAVADLASTDAAMNKRIETAVRLLRETREFSKAMRVEVDRLHQRLSQRTRKPTMTRPEPD